MSTTATLTYTVTPILQTPAQLQPIVAAVPLPFGDLINFGCQLSTDTTAIVMGNVVRTIVISLAPIFTPFSGAFPIVAPPNGFSGGCIVSSSKQDGPGGTGSQRARITGLDINNRMYNILVPLNGTTPVPLPPLQGNAPPVFPLRPTPFGPILYKTIATVTPDPPGSAAFAGMLSIFTDGGQVANVPPTALAQGAGSLLFQSAATPTNTWTGCVVVTSPDDGTAGINSFGAFNLTINFRDGNGVIRSQAIGINGPGLPSNIFNVPAANTPASLTSKAQGDPADGIVVAAAGPLGTNRGQISVFTGSVPTGNMDQFGNTIFRPVGFCAGTLAPSFQSQFPSTTLQKSFFTNLYTILLASALQSNVVAAAPVIA